LSTRRLSENPIDAFCQEAENALAPHLSQVSHSRQCWSGRSNDDRKRGIRKMSENDVIANQKRILQNQKSILANQGTIKANQETIKKNQVSILKNQATLDTIVKNQKKILAKIK
jgi:hypothetical protein